MKFKKSLYLTNSTYDGNVPAPIIILVYAGLGYVYQKRAIYESAEEYWTKVIDMRPLDFIRSIALLNRGQARLETNRLEGAVADLNEVIKESKPEVAALAHVNLGKAYFRQGLYEQAKQELLQAIKLKPDTTQAYYNMRVLLNSEGKPERAKKLFQTALTINSNYAAAKNVTSELDRAKVKKEEWLDWWTATRSRKVGAFVIIISLALIAVRPILNSISNLQTPASTFGIIGVIIIFFLLPFIKKLKVGPIELEMESIDKRLDLDIISRTK